MIRYLKVFDRPIRLSHIEISPAQILQAIELTNRKFMLIGQETARMSVDIFDIIDFRAFSGMIGEVFAGVLEEVLDGQMVKNPSIDGYPDLLQNVTQEMKEYFRNSTYDELLDYRYGGIEIKNTFELRKVAPDNMGDQRIHHINTKLIGAHHQKTNHLLALFPTITGKPTIVAAFYSDRLSPDDWQTVQRPRSVSNDIIFND